MNPARLEEPQLRSRLLSLKTFEVGGRVALWREAKPASSAGFALPGRVCLPHSFRSPALFRVRLIRSARSATRSRNHFINLLEQIIAVHDFYKRLARGLVADHVDSGGMNDSH